MPGFSEGHFLYALASLVTPELQKAKEKSQTLSLKKTQQCMKKCAKTEQIICKTCKNAQSRAQMVKTKQNYATTKKIKKHVKPKQYLTSFVNSL